MEYSKLQKSLDSEKKKKEKVWLNANVLELGLVELQELQKWLEAVDGVVKEKMNKIIVEASQISQGSVPQPLMEIAFT
ncbi:unnamed protein product [Miscanthus lutarioriparius]|uniref:Uncharacterized protein n=1 Tax=Miscanthus lutarioriparius TaxID=422564 RepID=A0A811RJN7_9POAL|nr:unnamed protein product [Miscanthus lutarioriparius]